MLYGAIAGDIAGSTYEFFGLKGDEQELFPKNSEFTDDTILTLAVADALNNGVPMAEAIRTYATLYPNPMGGYGSRFVIWLAAGKGTPAYNSYGNGSAMRVSACAWAGDTIDEVQNIARMSAVCTHNHPEGIKGAVATASAIFMARMGASKEEIRKYVHENFYDMSRSYEDLYNDKYNFHAACQDTVPEAIICFLESEDYESALRMVMLVNKDTDTAAAICGAIAGAFYGVPDYIKRIVREKLDEKLLSVLDDFEESVKGRRVSQSAPTTNCFQVYDERIWGCEYPFHLDEEKGKEKLQVALNFGITHFIDLTEEGELIPYTEYLPSGSFVKYCRYPIHDTGVPSSCQSMLDLLKGIEQIMHNANAKIYLHCWGGVGRTGMVVACWIAWKRHLSFYDTMKALDTLWEQCPKSNSRTIPDTEEQIDFIQKFIKYIE